MEDSKKRKADAASDRPSKKSMGKKQWRTPRKDHDGQASAPRNIEPGDSGVWATCNMKREGKCVSELRSVFEEYVTRLYGSGSEDDAKSDDEGDAPADIEAEIQRELESMRNSSSRSLFRSVKLETSCVVFFKTSSPVDPVELVHAICKDAVQSSERKQSRFIKKLTPMTLMGKATEKGLEEVAQKVLAPHFHGESNSGKKFAIRPNFRNHKVLTRDSVIKQVAAAVGPGHAVDLKNYDLLILVEVYQNVLGLSVVGGDYEQLKRYNLTEIYEPTPKPSEQL